VIVHTRSGDFADAVERSYCALSETRWTTATDALAGPYAMVPLPALMRGAIVSTNVNEGEVVRAGQQILDRSLSVDVEHSSEGGPS
jgi:biotin carboxyl carrier protein